VRSWRTPPPPRCNLRPLDSLSLSIIRHPVMVQLRARVRVRVDRTSSLSASPSEGHPAGYAPVNPEDEGSQGCASAGSGAIEHRHASASTRAVHRCRTIAPCCRNPPSCARSHLCGPAARIGRQHL
jgi:hypothetical protein